MEIKDQIIPQLSYTFLEIFHLSEGENPRSEATIAPL